MSFVPPSPITLVLDHLVALELDFDPVTWDDPSAAARAFNQVLDALRSEHPLDTPDDQARAFALANDTWDFFRQSKSLELTLAWLRRRIARVAESLAPQAQ